MKAVHLIVDHNPDPHLAAFDVTPAMGRLSLQFRIKMKRTTWVRAIVETNTGEVWADYARVAVSLERVRLMPIGEARIRLPARIQQGDDHLGAAPSCSIRWTPGSSARPTGSRSRRTSSRT